MEEERDTDKTDDDSFGNQVALQRVNRFIDKPRAIVAGHNLDSGGQRGRNLLQFCLYAVNHIEGIQAVAHDDNAAHGFSLALPIGRAAPLIGPK